jgi:hypothetical protein
LKQPDPKASEYSEQSNLSAVMGELQAQLLESEARNAQLRSQLEMLQQQQHQEGGRP